jgi:hypothetical protein
LVATDAPLEVLIHPFTAARFSTATVASQFVLTFSLH